MTYSPSTRRPIVSTDNSSTATLTASATFTGEWEDVGEFETVIVAVATDQDGTFTIQFSPDGSNVDSTLTRFYRTDTIEAPHRFTITRRYCRITFQNTSSSDQTYFRLQTTFGSHAELNAPTDSTLAQDFDAIVVRPTDFNDEVLLGRRQGYVAWSKFGYNPDIDQDQTETIWPLSGTFTRLQVAQTLDVYSTSGTDADGATPGGGATEITIYGLDENREEQTEVVSLNGATPVTTSNQWFGVNRVRVTAAGLSEQNDGDIYIVGSSEKSPQAFIPAGDGITQQCIFHVDSRRVALIDSITFSAIKTSGGAKPEVTFKIWKFDPASNTRREVYRVLMDINVENNLHYVPGHPFDFPAGSIIEVECTTDTDNTSVSARFSIIEAREFNA